MYNAVYHRSYEERNPIEVRIDKEKIIIVSYPGPDKSIRKSDIDNGQVIVRRYRNRRIGDFLKELKLTEGRATGIPKIIKSMEINESPKPIFDTDDDRTYFLVKLLINEYFIEDEVQDKVQDKVQDESIEEKNTITIDKLNTTELRLVGLLKHSNMSKKDIAFSLGYKSIPGNLRKAMDNLLEQGLIGYTIPDKIKSKNQKYKLTKFGESFEKTIDN